LDLWPADHFLVVNSLKMSRTRTTEMTGRQGQIIGATLLLGLVSSAFAAHAHLSARKVEALAAAAAQSASYDKGSFVKFGGPYFDPVTRVWLVDFMGKAPGNREKRFSVYVFDATSRTEVTCLGVAGFESARDSGALPNEVRTFVPSGEHPMELYCADLNGDGLSDYVFVTEDEQHTKRTMQILIRKPNGQLTSAVSNANAVQPPFEDGINGSHRINVRRNKFSIINVSAGSGVGDSHIFYFEYMQLENTWVLTRAEKEITGTASADDRGGKWSQKDFGAITINEFDRRRFQ
jgi:hypothetical protein